MILNPTSGEGGHAERIRDLATSQGFAVHETREAGDAVVLAREAAEDGVTLLAAAGGDGTVNEVVRGIDDAGALDRVTLGVIPAGTGNNFAGNIGVPDIGHAFRVLADGERRRIDLGTADGRLFVNSCVGGLTADASARTSSELKSRLGVLAYVLTTLQTATSFDTLPLSVRTRDGRQDTTAWSGEAICVLVGNARRFPAHGSSQANVEDGLHDVTIIERMPPADLLKEAAANRLFERGTPHITRLRTAALEIAVETDEPADFSFDGEMGSYRTLQVGVRPRALAVLVGEDYEPTPGD